MEQENQLRSTGLTLRERAKTVFSMQEDAEILDSLDSMMNAFSKGQTYTPSSYGSPKTKFDPVVLQQFSKSGSITAARLLTAIDHYHHAMLSLLSDKEINNRQIIHHLAEAYKIEQLVVKIPIDIIPVLNNLIEEFLNQARLDSDSSLDMESRICYAFLNGNDVKHVMDFTKACIRLYPKERSFQLLYCNMCGFAQKFEDGARQASKSLELFPNDCDLLYAKAVHTRLMGAEQLKVIKAYEEYLTHVPVDDRKCPEAYYAVGLAYYVMAVANIKSANGRAAGKPITKHVLKAREYYKKGVESEQLQLPPFLPCKSKSKKILESSLKIFDYHVEKSKHGSLSKSLGMPTKREPKFGILTDPSRVAAIIAYRTARAELARYFENNPSRMKILTTQIPKHSQQIPITRSGLVDISFNDMDPTVDHIYENSILHVTSIEPANTGMTSIGILTQDMNFSVCRAFIYNFNTKDEEKIQKRLGVGAQLSIVNPYMRQAVDGQFGIRVDNIKCLELKSPSRNNYCRFCGQDSSSTCIRCGKAQYCSKECQTNDWKIMKHKLICVKCKILVC